VAKEKSEIRTERRASFFGLRISDFPRHSEFGFRIYDVAWPTAADITSCALLWPGSIAATVPPSHDRD